MVGASNAAIMDGLVVGAISCRRELLGSKTRGCLYNLVYIMTLGVLQQYRRLSIGSVLVDLILESCVLDGSIDHIALHVHVLNYAAISFYERLGFVIVNRVTGYYAKSSNLNPQDAFLLQRMLL